MIALVMDCPMNVANTTEAHWAVRRKAKKTYYLSQDQRQLLGLVPPPPERPLAQVGIRAEFWLWNTMDEDNLAARMKWVLDWLKTRGYIADDGPGCIIGGIELAQRIDRKAYGRVRVIIEPVA